MTATEPTSADAPAHQPAHLSRRIDWHQEGWNRIAGGLHIGGHWRHGGEGPPIPVVVGREFQLVASLHYQSPGYGPPMGVRHSVYPIPDNELEPEELAATWLLGRQVANVLSTGRQVLVRCAGGYNRSGLVCGQALIWQGRSPQAAIDLIRRRRGPDALSNDYFVQYLLDGPTAR